MNTLILAAALLGQCPDGQCSQPQNFNFYLQQPQRQYVPQPRYAPYVPATPPNVRYLQPLLPGDVLIPRRVGVFGWRTRYYIYRRP